MTKRTAVGMACETAFREFTGHDPAGIWSAPGRVNLIGEHTDYNGGFVLPFAIENRTHAALGHRGDGQIRVMSTINNAASVAVHLRELEALFSSGSNRRPELGWAAYPLGVAWAMLRRAGLPGSSLQGVDIVVASDVPVGAGLSSSAAIECAVALALNDTWELGLDRTALAEIGRTAENEAVGAPTGIMDQMASVMGCVDSAILLDCSSLEFDVIDLGFADHGMELLVVDTGVRHAHATGGYAARRASCELASRALGLGSLRELAAVDLDKAASVLDDVTFRRVRHVVGENQRVLDTVNALQAGDLPAVGSLLTASHISLRDDYEVSVPELDAAVAAALHGGSVGARMTGGGFGGSVIAIIQSDLLGAVSASIRQAFTDSSFQEPTIFVVTPSAGAQRDC